jgi:small subunit ribosomal protein S27e
LKKRKKEPIPKPRSRFIKVRCPDCGNEQIIFDKTSEVVQCNVCEGVMAEPTGGRAKIRGEVIAELE